MSTVRRGTHQNVLFCLFFSLGFLFRPSSGAAESIDLSFIPRDAIAAVVMHPRILLTDPKYAFLPHEVVVAACEENFGIDPREIELAIGTFSMEGVLYGQPSVGAILHFREPYDQKQLIDRLGENAIELSYNEKPYWKIPDASQVPVCLAMPSEKVLLFGTESQITKMLSADKVDSKLIKLLAASDFSKSVVAVLDFNTVRPMLLLGLQQMGPPPAPIEPFLEIPKLLKSIHLTIELNPLFIEFTFGADDETDATKFKELMEKAKEMAGAMIEEQMSDLAPAEQTKTALAAMQYTRRMIKAMFDAIQVVKDGENVRVSMSGEMAPAMATSGVFAALLLPAIQQAREAARRTQSASNLKNIAVAMLNYHDVNRSFPAQAIRDAEGKPLLSWRVAILPYIEQLELYKQFKLDEPWDSEHNRSLLSKMPAVYANPNVPGNENTVYLALVGKGGVFDGEKGTPIRMILDGTSRTLLAAEANADQAVPWTKPEDLEFDPDQPFRGLGNLRPNGFNVLFADGSVHFILKSVDPNLLRALFTIDGREDIQLP
ncbi:MAG: DUF1559 domain-containing protein [Planctomycetota bacterium]